MIAVMQQAFDFDSRPVRRRRARVDNAQQLDRVMKGIGAAVLDFCRARSVFRGADLCDYVRQRCGGTPESAARILRQLRRQGLVEYENTVRAGSLYTVRRVSNVERRS